MSYEPFSSISNRKDKERIAKKVASRAQSGDIIGAGSGSTSYLALLALAGRKDLENISVVPSSLEIGWVAEEAGLRVVPLQRLSWAFDGADEVDPKGNLIKGRGGALLREKMNFQAAGKVIVVADKSKMVASLGERFPVPVEVLQSAYPMVVSQLKSLGAEEMVLRTGSGKDGPTITESGNLLLDVHFGKIEPGLSARINQIAGVAENGLFEGFSPEIIS